MGEPIKGQFAWQLGPGLTRRIRDDSISRATSPPDDAPSLLLVDDDPTADVLFRARYRRQLAARALVMRFASSGPMALELLTEHPDIEVVITDLNMPEMPGLELLSALRARHPLVRAIVVSAYSDLDNIRAAMNRGAFDFVTKPISFHDLEITIGRTVEHVRQLRRGEFLRTEKLAALGRLVSGVAHELGTPLGVAVTAITLGEDRLERLGRLFESGELRRSQLAEYIRDARESTRLVGANLQRAADLLAGFKRVAVDQHPEARGTIQLAPFLENVVRRVAPLLRGANHCVSTACNPNLTIVTYPDALSRALTNLLTNAIVHAYDVEDYGSIELSATIEEPASIVLRVIDDGRGMPESTRARLFDPFFTTRRGGGNTGLGMFIVHNIVSELLRGRIAVHSAPGQGTTIELRLPAAARAHHGRASSGRAGRVG